jgi:tryptophan-rich sensory protein
MYLVQKNSPIIALVLFVLLCEGVGLASGYLANVSQNHWFDQLIKPSWNPPAYLFGPVWTILYFLMGVSLWLVWKNKSRRIIQRKYLFIIFYTVVLKFYVEHHLLQARISVLCFFQYYHINGEYRIDDEKFFVLFKTRLVVCLFHTYLGYHLPLS